MLGRIKRVSQAYKASIALSHHKVGHVLHKRLCDDTLNQGTIHTLLSLSELGEIFLLLLLLFFESICHDLFPLLFHGFLVHK